MTGVHLVHLVACVWHVSCNKLSKSKAVFSCFYLIEVILKTHFYHEKENDIDENPNNDTFTGTNNSKNDNKKQ